MPGATELSCEIHFIVHKERQSPKNRKTQIFSANKHMDSGAKTQSTRLESTGLPKQMVEEQSMNGGGIHMWVHSRRQGAEVKMI